MASIARESDDGGSRLSRIEAQFDLSTAPWLKRVVGRAVMLALGGARRASRSQRRRFGQACRQQPQGRCRLPHQLSQGPAAKGRPVIFIHGTPGNASGWADYLLSPPDGLRCVALDRPGFGGSGPRDGGNLVAGAGQCSCGSDPRAALGSGHRRRPFLRRTRCRASGRRCARSRRRARCACGLARPGARTRAGNSALGRRRPFAKSCRAPCATPTAS